MSAAIRPESEDVAMLAERAYIFGYPLVLMAVTRDVMTSTGREVTPLNQFNHLREFPDASFRDVVSPNADTLYSSAWLDLSREPIVLSVPETHGRYYLMPTLSGWTDVFASPGKRTTGTGPAQFAFTGPHWRGKLPAGLDQVRSPTDMAWLIGRTQTNGKSDYANVRALQDRYLLTPLSLLDSGDLNSIEAPGPARSFAAAGPAEQVAHMDAPTFFGRLAALLVGNPPSPSDAPAMQELARLGVQPGRPFRPAARHAAALAEGLAGARKALQAEAQSLSGALSSRGWKSLVGLGQYGTDYGKRAVIALIGLGANLSSDAVYAQARTDTDHRPLDGSKRYSVHFEPGQTPPVDAFWSITMYDDRQFFIPNAIDRYAIGDRDRLTYNPDGSLDLYVQREAPAEQERSNWLPAPSAPFNLILRMYQPRAAVQNGQWSAPVIAARA